MIYSINKAIITVSKPPLKCALLIKINLPGGSVVILCWCCMCRYFQIYIILIAPCFTNGNTRATLLSKPFKQPDECRRFQRATGRRLGLETDWKKMSPWKEVMLDCAELDQRLMLARAFDLTSLPQYSNLLCIHIGVLQPPPPQLFSSSGFGWHW